MTTAKRYKKLKETDITCMSCGRGAWENSEGNTICSNCDKEENKCKCKPIKEGKYLVTFSEYLEFKYPKMFGDKTFNDFLYAKLPNKVFKSDGSYQNPRMNDYMDEYEQWLKTDEAVKVFKLLKSKNESTKQSPIFTLKECVAINGGKVILEKGETIAVLKESYDWDDIVDLAKKEKLDSKVIGFVKFIDKNKDKYKAGIKDFVDWWNEAMGEADLDTIEKLIAKNPPEETGFEGLPSNEWVYYTGKATESVLKEDYTFYIKLTGEI